ncbi:MAG: tRNA 5-methoxyuridine(34)/uridine 5-oxyacetic acid(34) synthase CmoB [Proteobacteria bacterium]|nr:tRNA 5-methoxyuridine(34)/uridine 5-oxyacetic acid(34) synthase CmoB [Pseudomonadota bacterium]
MYENLIKLLSATPLARWAEGIPELCSRRLSPDMNRDIIRWQEAIDTLPALPTGAFSIENGIVTFGTSEDGASLAANGGEKARQRIERNLSYLHPWRKGPYSIYGVTVDTEWRSDLKWERLKDHFQPLAQRLVLDVGCGNGYHCWRMRAEGARLVIGIDPSPLFVMQFRMIGTFSDDESVRVLPFGIEEMPSNVRCFDTVFSMGVFHHRRSPFDHLFELKSLLRPGGELVLETLVVEGADGEVLVPEDRYAKMRNVWFIPSTATLASWLNRAGFRKTRLVDVTTTTTEEQRSTAWMRFESLADFLDTNDLRKTIEGYPAPVRAIFLAESP